MGASYALHGPFTFRAKLSYGPFALYGKVYGFINIIDKYATKYAMKQEKGSKAFDKMMAECIEC